MPELSKFDKLRLKTEYQLVQIIKNGLDHGIRDARQALKNADSWALAEHLYRRAKKAHDVTHRLVPLVGEITVEQQNDVKSRLEHLGRMLEALSAIASKPVTAEDKIAALARAFWEVRGCPEGAPEEDWFRAERTLKSKHACVGC